MASESVATAPSADPTAASTANDDDVTSSNYYRTFLPPSVRTELEAGAFRSLCEHLRDRSDEVQNIDLMTVSGFCRNCLAKWLVVEARKLSSELQAEEEEGKSDGDTERIARALDSLGYDEAAEEVYGCGYAEWKARHARKATDEQMELYAASKRIHAAHDKELLKTKGERPKETTAASSRDARERLTPSKIFRKTRPSAPGGGGGAPLSDVCCQDVDGGTASVSAAERAEPNAGSGGGTGYVPPPPPRGTTSVRVGILTVSDRAASDGYETGDLGGPAVERSLRVTVAALNEAGGGEVRCDVAARAVVPDETSEIGAVLTDWSAPEEDGGGSASAAPRCDLILTTGGTGFAPRDVTPEATLAVLERESRGLMAWVSAECAVRYRQPMASLSRATAGVRGRTVLANLPGNPAGAAQVVEVALPLLVHAVRDVQDN